MNYGEAMTQAQGAIVGGLNLAGARREKHWGELDAAEQIERMRGEVKRLMRIVEAQERVVSMLRDHRHAPVDGALMVTFNRASSGRDGELVGYRRDEQWF